MSNIMKSLLAMPVIIGIMVIVVFLDLPEAVDTVLVVAQMVLLVVQIFFLVKAFKED